MATSKIDKTRMLLWTNPSPSGGFDSQTINLDLSNYSAVEIQCHSGPSGNETSTVICPIGKNTIVNYLGGGNAYGSGGVFLAQRGFEVSTSGIYVRAGLGTFIDTSTPWAYNSNTRMIPWRIYGIK